MTDLRMRESVNVTLTIALFRQIYFGQITLTNLVNFNLFWMAILAGVPKRLGLFVLAAFAFCTSAALACESNTGPLNREGEFWVVTHVFDPNGTVSTEDFLLKMQGQLNAWPCSEVLVTRDGLLALTVGTVGAQTGSAQVAAWMNRAEGPLPADTKLYAGSLMAERFLNGTQFAQLLSTYPATDLIGYEVLFASRDYQGLWVMRLDTNGQVTVRSMDGDFFAPRVGRWSIGDDLLLCTYFPSESCGRLEPNGSGLLVRAFPSGQVHSDIFFWQDIGEFQKSRMLEQLPTRSNAKILIMGRTLKDREVWVSTLYPKGNFEFRTGGAQIGQGVYRLVPDGVCYLFENNVDEICRYAKRQQDGRILWQHGEGTAAISEVLGILTYDDAVQPQATPEEVPQVIVTVPRPKTAPSSVPPRRVPLLSTNPACRDIGSFCTQFVLQSSVCGFLLQGASDTLSSSGDTGVVGGAASGVACTAMASALHDLDVTPEDVATAALGGAAGSAAMAAESAWAKGLWAVVSGLAGVSSHASCKQALVKACY